MKKPTRGQNAHESRCYLFKPDGKSRHAVDLNRLRATTPPWNRFDLFYHIFLLLSRTIQKEEKIFSSRPPPLRRNEMPIDKNKDFVYNI